MPTFEWEAAVAQSPPPASFPIKILSTVSASWVSSIYDKSKASYPIAILLSPNLFVAPASSPKKVL